MQNKYNINYFRSY